MNLQVWEKSITFSGVLFRQIQNWSTTVRSTSEVICWGTAEVLVDELCRRFYKHCLLFTALHEWGETRACYQGWLCSTSLCEHILDLALCGQQKLPWCRLSSACAELGDARVCGAEHRHSALVSSLSLTLHRHLRRSYSGSVLLPLVRNKVNEKAKWSNRCTVKQCARQSFDLINVVSLRQNEV